MAVFRGYANTTHYSLMQFVHTVIGSCFKYKIKIPYLKALDSKDFPEINLTHKTLQPLCCIVLKSVACILEKSVVCILEKSVACILGNLVRSCLRRLVPFKVNIAVFILFTWDWVLRITFSQKWFVWLYEVEPKAVWIVN